MFWIKDLKILTLELSKFDSSIKTLINRNFNKSKQPSVRLWSQLIYFYNLTFVYLDFLQRLQIHKWPHLSTSITFTMNRPKNEDLFKMTTSRFTESPCRVGNYFECSVCYVNNVFRTLNPLPIRSGRFGLRWPILKYN